MSVGQSDTSAYRPWDRDEKLGPVPEGGFKPDDPKVIAWEAAHGHDLRLKCLPEFGCLPLEERPSGGGACDPGCPRDEGILMGQDGASYEWVTVLVIRHEAGSREGAIHQRNVYDKLIVESGGETMMAWTECERDAMAVGYRVFERLGADNPEIDPDA